MTTITQDNSKFADAQILEDHGPILRRHASCPPGILREVYLATDPTRRMPASATRSLLITRDDQARVPSTTIKYFASVSSPINPGDSNWTHVSMTTQAQLELGLKAKDVRIALETGSFETVYPPGLGSCCQMGIDQEESPLNAWTNPLVYGRYDDEHYYDNGYYHEHLSPIHMHTCLLSTFVPSDAHTPSSSSSSCSCPGSNDLTQEASTGSLEDYILQGLSSISLGMNGVHRKDKGQMSATWDST